MNEKDRQRLRHYENLIKAGRKAGEGKPPLSCAKCPYFQPDFRYRKCLYARCPYGRKTEVFRDRPLGRERIAVKEKPEAVNMDG